MPTTRGQRQENDKPPPPPPHKPPPPQGWGLREGKGGQRPPLTSGGGTGGEHAAWTGQRQGPRGVPHTPAGGQVPCRVPVPCLRRAYAGGRATRAHPPPLAPTSRTHQGQRRGQRGEGEGTRGMTVASGGPPPGDAAAGWRDRGARRPCPRGARAVQASTGGPQKGGQREPPPPPASNSDAHPQKGRGRRGKKRKKNKKNTKRATKDTNMPEQGQAAGADGTGREPGGTARGQGPWG